jgi:hydroxymethylpyrimidine/phosphomethylpyrimidine kinase
MTPPAVLTIAGSDSGGGAGLQADLKTFAALGVHGTCAVTAVTAQNTVGVVAVHSPPASFLTAQLNAVLSDFSVQATKTGFLATAENIAAVVAQADRLGRLVVDPVMVSSRGDRIVSAEAQHAYMATLFPRATIITPNAREAALLLGRSVTTIDDLQEAARSLHSLGPAVVVVKGGGLSGNESIDAVFDGTSSWLLPAPRVATPNNHGTGCSFSAATVAHLALGYSAADALMAAKEYVTAGLLASAAWRLGAGHGPIDHMHRYRSQMPQSSDAQPPS